MGALPGPTALVLPQIFVQFPFQAPEMAQAVRFGRVHPAAGTQASVKQWSSSGGGLVAAGHSLAQTQPSCSTASSGSTELSCTEAQMVWKRLLYVTEQSIICNFVTTLLDQSAVYSACCFQAWLAAAA